MYSSNKHNSFTLLLNVTKELIFFHCPAIPLYRFSTCVFFLFLYEGKHTSLSFPIFDPEIEMTTLLNSSLISYIFCLTIPTKLAAAGCSQTKSWFRMWSMVCMMFFLTSFNFCELYITSDNFVAFSILSWNSFFAGDRNKPVSFNQLRLWCKGSGVSNSIFYGFLGCFQNNIIFCILWKIGSGTDIIWYLIVCKEFIYYTNTCNRWNQRINEFIEWIQQETYNVFSNTIQVGMFHLHHTTTHSFNS